MTGDTWIAFGGLLLAILCGLATTIRWMLIRIESGDDKIKRELDMVDTSWGGRQAKDDLDFAQFKETVGREFLRRSEYEIAQRNTDRRLESIEAKVDKIPDSLDRQSERLIAALKDFRP
jgi:hypothetical protein